MLPFLCGQSAGNGTGHLDRARRIVDTVSRQALLRTRTNFEIGQKRKAELIHVEICLYGIER